MGEFSVGERVRVDIPDESDPDHAFHGHHGEIVETLTDEAGAVTGREADSEIYRVELEAGAELDLRHVDLRPPIE